MVNSEKEKELYRIKSLVNYAQNNNLYISGGSDYHGIKKPNIEIGMLNIPKKFIKNWYN